MEHNVRKNPLTVGEIIEWCSGVSEHSVSERKKTAGMIWNDSRKVGKGDIFVAITTENDDGHKYVENAFKQGAVAAIVERRKLQNLPQKYVRKCVFVKDPLTAIQKAATIYRNELNLLIVGITGTNGKTTTRTFTASVLRSIYSVGETHGNWNNHIGVPLSILKFCGDEWIGVIEMGANHLHEIHTLSKIAQPDIAIITNIGYGHVGLFGSLANTTKAKFEIVDGLNKKNGILLLNGDDVRLRNAAKNYKGKVIYFGTSKNCDIRAEEILVDKKRGVFFTVQGYRYQVNMPGQHFVYCALPAIYIAKRCGIPDDLIAEALLAQEAVSMRGVIEKKKGIEFILDCYNANPSSMKSGIDYLTAISDQKNRVAIVGDMLELGSYSKRLHKQLGKQLVEAKVQKIIAVGQFADEVLKGALAAGAQKKNLHSALTSEDAITITKKVLQPGQTVLLKGSRGIHLEKVFEGL